MQIDNHILTIGNYTEELPRLARPATVTVWQVPTEYVATGYFVATHCSGEPPTIPACKAEDAVLLGRMELPAHPDAVLAAITAADLRKVRQQAQDIILAKYPLWAQSNYALGIYPTEDTDAMKTAIASVITESNRCEDIAEAGGAATPNWPTI